MVTFLTNIMQRKSSSFSDLKEYSACAICLEEFVTESLVRVVPICEHVFHAKCIEKWFEHEEVIKQKFILI